jgi:short-subunit dehydrogenase
MSGTIAVFGVGSGLGRAVAERFGAEGYHVALVARREAPLSALVEELSAKGIAAQAFAADLTDSSQAADLVRRIAGDLGPISAVYYAPFDGSGFTAATELTPSVVEALMPLLVYTPIEIVRAVLPAMFDAGEGTILTANGAGAVHGAPYMSGFGPAMAAQRNYLQSLHGELIGRGVYVGTLSIGAGILGSAAHQAARAAGQGDAWPTVDPTELAEILWSMSREKKRVETIYPEGLFG